MNLYQPTITGSLSVSGSVNISGSITIAGGGTISGTASIATNAITASSADNFLVRNTLTAQTLVVQTITSSVDFVTGSTRFGSISANTHVFSGSVTMNPNGLFVSSSELVGIGTITPSSKLDVTDANGIPLRIGDISAAPSSQTAGYIGMSTSAYSGNNGDLVLYPRTSATSKILLMGGNVGIGTTTPSGQFHIQATNSGIIFDTATAYTPRIKAAGALSDLQIESVGNGGNLILSAPGTTSVMTMNVSGSEKMRITSAGMFQVGTNSSGSAGDWIARIKNASTSGYGLDIQAGNGSGNTALLVRSYNGGVDFLSIRGDGMVILPSQPSFSMWVSLNATGPGVVPFGGTNYNDGGYFNTTTYRFTAPVAGRYFFSFYNNVYANSSASTYFTFRVNATYRGAFAYYSNKSVGNWHLVSFQQVIKLNSGDYVDVYNNSVDRGDYGSDAWGNFSGHLLG